MGKCVLLNFAAFWNDDNCGESHGFICKRRNDSTAPVIIPPTPVSVWGCNHGFTPVPNRECTQLFHLSTLRKIPYVNLWVKGLLTVKVKKFVFVFLISHLKV